MLNNLQNASNMPSKTLGWNFSYILDEKIDCDDNLQKNRPDVEFVTKIDEKSSQLAITGFEIKSTESIQDNAQHDADQKANALMWLLISSSGTYSTHSLRGYNEITESGSGKVVACLTSKYSIRNNAVLGMSDDKFRAILNRSDQDLVEKMQFVSLARQAEKTSDYGSIIKYLYLACDEKPPENLKKFKFLRNAISLYSPKSSSPLLRVCKVGQEQMCKPDPHWKYRCVGLATKAP